MTRRLFPCPRSSDAATTPNSYSSSSTSPALTTTSKKHPVISAPFSKRSQPIGKQQGMMGANNIGCHYRLEPRVIDRRSSWESTRRGQVGCYEREGVRESLVSVVVTEPDDRRFHLDEEDRESLASIREKHSLRNDTSTYSMYTSQCIEGLSRLKRIYRIRRYSETDLLLSFPCRTTRGRSCASVDQSALRYDELLF